MNIKWFGDMKINKKLIISFVVVNALFIILLCIILSMMNLSTKKMQTAYVGYGETAAETAVASAGLQGTQNAVNKLILGAQRGDTAAAEAEVNMMLGVLSDKMDKIGTMTEDEELKRLHRAADKAVNAFLDEAAIVVKAVAEGKIDEAASRAADPEYTSIANNAAVCIEALFDTAYDTGEAQVNAIRGNQSLAVWIMLAGTVIVLALAVGDAMFLSGFISKPVNSMREAAEKLAVGDVNVEITKFYDDELGGLADSLIKMQANIKAQAEVAHIISEGELDMEFASNGESDLLGNAIVTMINEENRVMGGISESVMQIGSGSKEVASASQSLAQGSTEQASAIQQITASITDITERTRVNAEDAKNANELVLLARTDATESTGKMQEMITAMADINVSSENISKIIKVIDDIAFQTNILALNAAVEAARAGVHGRGFAVVADEVRNLAGKSAQAASETAELIEDSIAKVAKGSKLAEETAGALDAISKVIERIVAITNSIAVASNDQATAVAQIDQAIGQVSQVVQTNSATSEQCAAASEELSNQVTRLRDMIARYKLKETHDTDYDDVPVINLPEPDSSYDDFDFDGTSGLPDDDDDFINDVPPVISLDDGYGKY